MSGILKGQSMKRKCMWIVRDGDSPYSDYLVSTLRPKCDKGGWYEAPGRAASEHLFRGQFERLTGLKLKPGAPPVKIRLTLVRT